MDDPSSRVTGAAPHGSWATRPMQPTGINDEF
jgi:hypothetical protein